MKFLSMLLLAALTGCATQSATVAASLNSAKPIVMCTLKKEGYVVQSGLPVPLGQRMEELDVLCGAH